MNGKPLSLQQLLAVSKTLAERDRSAGLATVQWTEPQHRYIHWTPEPGQPDILLFRAGNQTHGKSFVGIADDIMRCTGDHPVDKRGLRPDGIEAVVLSPSDTHSVQIQGKAWALVRKEQLLPGQTFDPVKGLRGRRAALKFQNGSVLHFRTSGQGALNLSGSTLDHVHPDELCPEGVYEEMKMRVARRNGTMRLTLTPVNAPADWLRKRIEAGELIEHHYRCEPRWCIPIGSTEPLKDPKTGRPMDAAWIAEYIASVAEHSREVRCHGEWQIAHDARDLAGWSDSYVYTDDDNLPAFVEYGIGIDYGEGIGRTVALFCGFSPEGGVYVFDEWCCDGKTPVREQARNIRHMVESHGLRLANIRRVVGDINNARAVGEIISMNRALEREFVHIEREAGRDLPNEWRISKPFKPPGSVDTRLNLINEALSDRRLRVNERCNRLLTSFRTYQKGIRQALVLKDPLDALGYVAEKWLRKNIPQPTPDRWAVQRR